MTSLAEVAGRAVTTIEGLSDGTVVAPGCTSGRTRALRHVQVRSTLARTTVPRCRCWWLRNSRFRSRRCNSSWAILTCRRSTSAHSVAGRWPCGHRSFATLDQGAGQRAAQAAHRLTPPAKTMPPFAMRSNACYPAAREDSSTHRSRLSQARPPLAGAPPEPWRPAAAAG